MVLGDLTIFQLITSLYGVSERLQGLMCTEPVTRRPRKPAQPRKRQSQTSQVDPSLRDQLDDLESAIALEKIAKTDSSHDASSLSRLTFAQVTDQIWHFSSVDYGTRCKYPFPLRKGSPGKSHTGQNQIHVLATILYSSPPMQAPR